MLDVALVRETPQKLRENLRKRQLTDQIGQVDNILSLDERRRKLIQKIEVLRSERNKISSQISGGDDQDLIGKAALIKEKIQSLEPQLKEVEGNLQEILWQMPNFLHPDVPEGKDESENKIIRKRGKPTEFDFEVKDHVALGESLDMIDIGTASKVSGARFYYLKGEAVLIQFALVQFVLKAVTDAKIITEIASSVRNPFDTPFTLVIPPVLMRPEIMQKMGRLEPVEDRYVLEKDDLVLVGSAEHTLGPMLMDEIILKEKLPIRYLGYSTAFRQEAGSYGRDTRGILRVHQFDKLEFETFIQPEYGEVEQDFLVAMQEYFMQKLKIPYQVVAICTGDMGGPDYRQIDIEAWLPGQGEYRETHTSDFMTDYQARRLNIKFKDAQGERQHVHMNDATALAIGRTLIAILENYQQKDGSVVVPEVLREYVGKEVIRSTG